MAQVTYSPRKFANATGKVAALSHAVDTARNAGSAELLAWGQQAIMGLREGKLTIEAIQQAIITACHPITDNAPKLADMTIGHCGSTIKGRFYALKRIAADKESGDKLLAGESFNVVAKAAPQLQVQDTGKRNKGGKGGKGKASKPREVTLETALASVNSWLEQAVSGDVEMARGLAKNETLARIIANCGKLGGIIAAADKAADKADKAEKVKATRIAREQAKARKARQQAAKQTPASKPLPTGRAKTSVRLLKAA